MKNAVAFVLLSAVVLLSAQRADAQGQGENFPVAECRSLCTEFILPLAEPICTAVADSISFQGPPDVTAGTCDFFDGFCEDVEAVSKGRCEVLAGKICGAVVGVLFGAGANVNRGFVKSNVLCNPGQCTNVLCTPKGLLSLINDVVPVDAAVAGRRLRSLVA